MEAGGTVQKLAQCSGGAGSDASGGSGDGEKWASLRREGWTDGYRSVKGEMRNERLPAMFQFLSGVLFT